MPAKSTPASAWRLPSSLPRNPESISPCIVHNCMHAHTRKPATWRLSTTPMGHLQATKSIDQLLISITLFTQQSAKCNAKTLPQQTVPSDSANAPSAQSFVLYILFESQECPGGKSIVYEYEQIFASIRKTLFAFFVYKSIIATV